MASKTVHIGAAALGPKNAARGDTMVASYGAYSKEYVFDGERWTLASKTWRGTSTLTTDAERP